MTYLFAFAACVAWTGGVPARRIRPRAVSWGWVPPVALAVALLVIVTDRAAVVIAAALAGATVLYAYSRRRAGQALVRRQEAASQFLGHISASLQAGSSLLDATLRATDQLPDTTPTDLLADASLFCHVLRTGDAAGLRTPELSRVEALWRVGVQRGVPIASLVTAAREEIDAALRHRARLRPGQRRGGGRAEDERGGALPASAGRDRYGRRDGGAPAALFDRHQLGRGAAHCRHRAGGGRFLYVTTHH